MIAREKERCRTWGGEPGFGVLCGAEHLDHCSQLFPVGVSPHGFPADVHVSLWASADLPPSPVESAHDGGEQRPARAPGLDLGFDQQVSHGGQQVTSASCCAVWGKLGKRRGGGKRGRHGGLRSKPQGRGDDRDGTWRISVAIVPASRPERSSDSADRQIH